MAVGALLLLWSRRVIIDAGFRNLVSLFISTIMLSSYPHIDPMQHEVKSAKPGPPVSIESGLQCRLYHSALVQA